MPNVNMFAKKPSNTSYGADTRNLGFSGASPWGDSSPQNSDPNFNFGGASNPMAGAGGPNKSSGIISNYMTQQRGENARSRAANIGRWNEASGYLKNFANPLSPDVIAKMKSMNAMGAQGAANNQFREEQGLLGMGGQMDASSQAAAADAAHRNFMGASVGADSKLETDAALQNNTAGLQVGTSILNSLPQDRPDDLSGFAQLQLGDNDRNYSRGLMENAMNRPISPGATNGKQMMGGGGGVNPFGASYNPNGMPHASQWGNGAPNGNSMLPPVSMPWMGNTEPAAPGWQNFTGRHSWEEGQNW